MLSSSPHGKRSGFLFSSGDFGGTLDASRRLHVDSSSRKAPIPRSAWRIDLAVRAARISAGPCAMSARIVVGVLLFVFAVIGFLGVYEELKRRKR